MHDMTLRRVQACAEASDTARKQIAHAAKQYLGDDGHGRAQLGQAHLGNVHTIYDNAAAVQLCQPE